LAAKEKLKMNSDFRDLLRILAEEKVELLVVGGYAVIHHTQPRYTKDLNIWIKPCRENARRVAHAFLHFGVPMIEDTEEDFAKEGLQYAIGMPPSQIDFLTSLPGVAFDAAWKDHVVAQCEGVSVSFLGIPQLIVAKTHAGRPQDLADLDELRRAGNSANS
jgi:hypothetical protein